jgi:hypothetical protein
MNEQNEQTITKQSHAALLCLLAMLCGFMFMSGAVTSMVSFLWDGFTSIIMLVIS